MRKRGLLLSTVCLMMAGVLAGCGSSNEQDASTSQKAQAETVTEPKTASDTLKASEGVSAEEYNT